MSTLWDLNYTIFQAINNVAGKHHWLDGIMIFCADYLIFCWFIFLLFLWGIPLQWRKRTARAGETTVLAERRATVIWVGVACVLAYGLNLLLEQFIFEQRPFVAHKVHLLISHVSDASFPSDHTAWSFAVVGMLIFTFLPFMRLQERLKSTEQSPIDRTVWRMPVVLLIVALVIACSIGFARIYVGVHYPDDILGGTIDGLIAAAIVSLLRFRLRRPTASFLQAVTKLRLT